MQLKHLVRAGGLLWTVLLLVYPMQAGAGQGIINVNQHRTANDGGCIYVQNCGDGGVGLPFPDIATQGEAVDVFAFHVNAWDDPHDPLRGRFCKAVCDYEYADRPKIISTDFGAPTLTDVQTWIDRICDDTETGRLHFEHKDDSIINDLGNVGGCIGGFSTWPEPGQDMLRLYDQAGTNCMTVMHPNFTLLRGTGADSDKLYWKNARSSADPIPTTLIGFGFMGAVAAGDRLDVLPFLKSVRRPYYADPPDPPRYHKGANFMRIWAVEEWTAQAPDDQPGCITEDQTEGPTPFAGSFDDPEDPDYHLWSDNPRFYSGLRRFVQEAADRGIAVNLSLFDKHGLVDFQPACQHGRWYHSPYSKWNNDSGPLPGDRYLDDPPAICDCPPPGEPDAALASCLPTDFLDEEHVVQDHDRLMKRIATEVGGVGNVMFEIMNEMRAADGGNPADWGAAGQQWQIATAAAFRTMLPEKVIRDAFNGFDRALDLNTQVPDARPGASESWSANNVRISATLELGNYFRLGWATSNAEGGKSTMSAGLPFSEPASFNELSVRADLTASDGTLQLQISNSLGHSIQVRLDEEAGEVQLYKVGGWPGEAAEILLGTAEIANPTATHNVRLRLGKHPAAPTKPIARVFVDGENVLGPLEVGIFTMDITQVGFAGWNGSIPYPTGVGQVDNFEAAYFNMPYSE